MLCFLHAGSGSDRILCPGAKPSIGTIAGAVSADGHERPPGQMEVTTGNVLAAARDHLQGPDTGSLSSASSSFRLWALEGSAEVGALTQSRVTVWRGDDTCQ